jgi:hypothetical protein
MVKSALNSSMMPGIDGVSEAQYKCKLTIEKMIRTDGGTGVDAESEKSDLESYKDLLVEGPVLDYVSV